MLQKIGRLLTLAFIGFLPWSVIVTVGGTERLDIDSMRFCKEIFMAIIFLVAIFDIGKKKYRPTFDVLDGVIVLYIITLLLVSFFTNSTPA